MERFRRTNLAPAEPSRSSSLYSNDSYKQTNYSEYAESTTSTSSRPMSFTPSYMNAMPSRKPIASKSGSQRHNRAATQPAELPSMEPPATAIPLAKGVLLLAIAAAPHPATVQYVGRILKRGDYSTIVIVGSADTEAALKQLKMDLYALLGKMSLEVGIILELQKSWSELDVSAVITKTLESKDPLQAVLCSPSFPEERTVDVDILDMDATDLERLWRSSTGFLHSVAKATIPSLHTNSDTKRGKPTLFAVTEPMELNSAASVCKAACDRTLAILSHERSSSWMAIAYADSVLIPDPEPTTPNGKLHLSTENHNYQPDITEFTPGESPTRLWNMWALQDELGAAD